MANYKTPDVYVEEISTLPPSVAGVSTAIPAFIGYTEKTSRNNENLVNNPVRINTLLEYKTIFGGPDKTNYAVNSSGGQIDSVTPSALNHLLYYHMEMYFANGGGSCYVISTGGYDALAGKQHFIDALGALEKEDEPTLILITDAVRLPSADYHELCTRVLSQCNKLGDRFGIFDVLNSDTDAAVFRNGIGQQYLMYGAAYAPNIRTSLTYQYNDEGVTIADLQGEYYTDANGVRVTYSGPQSDDPKVIIDTTGTDLTFSYNSTSQTLTITGISTGRTVSEVLNGWAAHAGDKGNFGIEQAGNGSVSVTNATVTAGGESLNYTALHSEYSTNDNGLKVLYSGPQADNPQVDIQTSGSAIGFSYDAATHTLTLTGMGASGKTVKGITDAWAAYDGDKGYFSLEQAGDGSEKVMSSSGPVSLTATYSMRLIDIKTSQTALYNRVKSELAKQRIVLPPSGAMAGIYAQTDRDRGVWKAPANVSVTAAIEPTVKVTSEGQENFNVDPSGAGKSINVIRQFSGKGTLVWGSRTLDGDSNEWRYVPVRRLFNLIEESTKKSSAFAVFEPNTPMTWLKVKGMIDSYLYGLWKQGALAGTTSENAYFVNVGLGSTMTEQDILEGRMIVEIGVAAVRPAEFIILRFSHKLQEA